eukprot:5050349-Alexandrium_andersonii.AAC.1
MYARTAGKEVWKRFSIPQGCPWSMTFLGLVMTPWIRMLRAEFVLVCPRALADDLLVATGVQGEATEEEIEAEHGCAVDCTVAYLQAMGSRVSHRKCWNMASTKRIRRSLAKRPVKGCGGPFAVLTHARDLGSHLCVAKRHVAPTLTRRVQAATAVAKRLATLPGPPSRRLAVVNGKVNAMALYGAPAAPVGKQALASLRSAVVDVVDRNMPQIRAPELVLGAVFPREIDPLAHLLAGRVAALRRACALRPELLRRAQEAFACYASQGHPATTEEREGDGRWQHESDAHGPVGLLVHTCWTCHAWCDCEFVLHTIDHSSLPILTMPHQHVRPAMFAVVRTARQYDLEQRRQECKGNGAVDWRIATRHMADLADGDRALLRRILAMGIWNQRMLTKLDHNRFPDCPWCGELLASWEHIWWRCPAFEKQRCAMD